MGARGARAGGAPGPLSPGPWQSPAVPGGFHGAEARPHPWRSLYLEAAVSLGRVLLKKLHLV